MADKVKKEMSAVAQTVSSEGFLEIENRLNAAIAEHTNINNVDDNLPPEEYKLECKARKKAKEIIDMIWGEAVDEVERVEKDATDYS